MIHDIPSVGVVEKNVSGFTSTKTVAQFEVPRFTGRKDQHNRFGSIQMFTVKGEDVPGSVPRQSLKVRMPSFNLIFLPHVVGFRPRRIPIIEHLEARVP